MRLYVVTLLAFALCSAALFGAALSAWCAFGAGVLMAQRGWQ